MSLSRLLECAWPQAQTLVPEKQGDGWTLFFSLGSPESRAQVVTARGRSFPEAWLSGAQALQKQRRKSQEEPCWLRVEVVNRAEALNWGQLKEKLACTKRNYFRFGLSFDAQFSRALLEMEINANAILYDGKIPVATPNAGNLARYSEQRFGEALSWPESDSETLWRFTTRGLFTDGRQVWEMTAQGRYSGFRQVEEWQQTALPHVITQGGDFLARQVLADGKYEYGWFPCFDRRIGTYNALRHASSTWALIDAWSLTRNPAHKAAIDRALDYLTGQLIQRFPLPDGGSADFVVDVGDEIKLGANAVAILALAKYSEITGETRYLEQMNRLAEGIAFMQDPHSGGFVHVLNAPDLSLKEAHRIIYYDGEAAFALMRLYSLTADMRWLDRVKKAVDHFIAKEHWRAHDHWLGYCINELTIYCPEEKYFRFALDNVRDHLDFVLDRVTTYPTLLELMMAAQQTLTRLANSPHRGLLADFDLDKFNRALESRARYLLNGFFWPELAMYFRRPRRIVGSFFIRHHGYRVRIDDVEHYLSGYVAYLTWLRRSQRQPVSLTPWPATQIMFLGENLRNVGNGIEVAMARRARLFVERLGQTPCIMTSAWNPALGQTVAQFKESGRLPQGVRVLSIYEGLLAMRDRGELSALVWQPPGPLLGRTRNDDGLYRLQFAHRGDPQRLALEVFVDSHSQALLTKHYQTRNDRAVLERIDWHQTGVGLVSFFSESAWLAALLHATLAPEVRWHFIVDKNLPWRDFVLSDPRARFNATVTAFIHSTHRLRNGRLKQAYTHLLAPQAPTDQILMLTQEQCDDLVRDGVDRRRLRVMPHAAPDTLNRRSSGADSRRVLYLARYSAEKRHELLVRAFRQVVQAVPDAELHTWGVGPLRQDLVRQVARLGLEKSVKIHGFTNDVAQAQSESCCAVLCSDQEGMPQFGLEALSYGTPLVSMEIQYGPRDLLAGFDCGRLVPDGDEQALAEALIEVLTHPERLPRMRQQARLSAARFHPDIVAGYWRAWWQACHEASQTVLC
ncbi:glycosyltransferase [Erwinia sp. CPCC 100877]|nr:glycosyltransferase [Erwinia sp. CPCC 100877]